MSWNEVVVHTSKQAEEAVTYILNELGANGVVIVDPHDLAKEKRAKYGELYELDATKYPKEGIFVKAYFIQNEQWNEKLDKIKQQISDLQKYDINIQPFSVTVNTVQEEDWANEWKKYFKPMKVSKQLVIVPSWESYDKTDDEKIIKMDPGMAFGTGTHPTTILSLHALESVLQPDDIVLDVGSGSGVLSIAAVLLGSRHVYSYDLDEVAVSSTMVNRDINNFQSRITVKQNDLLKNVDQKANVVVSNILADILLNVVDDAWNNLEENGYFITSGIIEQKANLVQHKMEECGFVIKEKNQQENWISFIAQKVASR